MMGSNDRTVLSPIWGLKDVLSGHIFTQGTMLTKMFLDIYMEGVGENEEQPAIQIGRSKIGIRDGQREESWGWGLEVTEDEEGKKVAERVADFDWPRLQAAMGERLTDGPYHRMDNYGDCGHGLYTGIQSELGRVGNEAGGSEDSAGEGGRRRGSCRH